MPATTNSVTTDEKDRIITIRQEEYSLKQDAFRKGYSHVIYASTVNVKKGFVNPSCDLTVYAARVVVDSGGGKIDLSGSDGAGFKAGERTDATQFKGGHDGGDGTNGADGKAGGNGGKLTIYAGAIQGGALEINCSGGAGGRAQDGGNGKGGAQPRERDKPAAPKMVQVGWDQIDERHRAPKYDWGGDVDKIGRWDFWAAWIIVAHQAQTGANGGNGGHAGVAGKPGNGGAGGQILLHSLQKPAIAKPKTDTSGGKAGESAVHGKPGEGAAAGLGGKYLYKADSSGVAIDWSAYDEDSKWDKEWNTKNSKTFGVSIDQFKNLSVKSEYIETYREGSKEYKKLKLRASSGARGRDGGYGPNGEAKAPPIPKAETGANGSFTQTQLDAQGEAFRNIPYPYLLMLQRSATAALLNQDNDEAADILRWLMLLTTPHKDADSAASEDSRNRQRVYFESENALLTRNRDAGANKRAAVCVYTDIKEYSDFVETSLKHVSRQEDYFSDYKKAQEKLTERNKALDEAIAEVRAQIVHLTGSTMEPGSIDYFVEKEKQLKSNISALDVQIIDYKDRLGGMPQVLQEEINAEVRKKTQITVWNALEFISMAAGVAVNFASAASSIASMVSKVKDFYKEALKLTTWGEIFKDGIWNRNFDETKKDLAALLDTDEWKAVDKKTKEFIKGATDFRAKIVAYDELSKSKDSTDFKLDLLDVQASVLIFDVAKLDLKKQRNEFEEFIYKFIDEYEQARTWKHVFFDFFDTTETRFDMLAHLSEVQAQRRELQYQRSLYAKNEAVLVAQKDKMNMDPSTFQGEDVVLTLEANLNLALDHALIRIMDESRAYRIWTLQDHAFPKIPRNITAKILRTNFHEPLWTKIRTELSSGSTPPRRIGTNTPESPFVWTREAYPREFEDFAKTGRMTLSVPVDPKTNSYFERLIDAKVYLRGATTQTGSAFYCVLKHHGVSEFLNRDRKIVTCYQHPRSVEMTWLEKGVPPQPDYKHDGGIVQPFDGSSKQERIRYSPYTTWELRVIRNFKPDTSQTVYNREIDLSKVEAVELRFDVYYASFHVQPAVRAAKKKAARR